MTGPARPRLLAGVLLAMTALASQPTLADEAVASLDGPSPFGADVHPLDEAVLDSERGGLLTPFGEISFGAVMRTIIDGRVALETQLIWTPEGPVQTVLSSANNIIQSVKSDLKFPADVGTTDATLKSLGVPTIGNMPGMDLAKEKLDQGLPPAIAKTGEVTQTGADALALAGRFVPPSNPALDTIVDAAKGLSGLDDPKPLNTTAAPIGVGDLLSGSQDTIGQLLTFDPTGAPASIPQQVAQATPPPLDDPIGDLVVASTATGQTPQEVLQAAAGLGINLGTITGGGAALVLAGENGGGTAILHNISETGLSNVLLNTAAGQDIRLETDITLVMPNLEAFQQEILSQHLQLDLFDAIGNALTNALP